MSNTLLLENLLVKLGCDASNYLKVIKSISDETNREMKSVIAIVKSANNRLKGELATTARTIKSFNAEFSATKTVVTGVTPAIQDHAREIKAAGAEYRTAAKSIQAFQNSAKVKLPKITIPGGGLGSVGIGGAGVGRAGGSLLGGAGRLAGGVSGMAYRTGRRLALGATGLAGASLASFATLDDSINRSMAVANESSNTLRKSLITRDRESSKTCVMPLSR
jgi:hypothetical protein